MKKLLYIISSVCLCSVLLLACDKENANEPTFNETPAAVAAAGQYDGLWTRILPATGDTIRDVPGQIIFGVDTLTFQTDSLNSVTGYYASIRFVCDSLKLNTLVQGANIAYSNTGFVFFCDEANTTNGLKRSFAGRIDNDGGLEINFPMTQRISGRIRKFTYSFTGARSL